MTQIATISVERLAELAARGEVDVLDVRTPAEFRELRAAVASNVPLDDLDPHHVMQARNGSADEPLYVICRSGNRAAKACAKFIAAGYPKVLNVEGGTQAWHQAGLPVIKGQATISLERQVRIAAGFLVLLGAVMALVVHPWFAGLAAFVGGGLMFAGITDTCAMASLLAKMPWNQVGREETTCCAR